MVYILKTIVLHRKSLFPNVPLFWLLNLYNSGSESGSIPIPALTHSAGSNLGPTAARSVLQELAASPNGSEGSGKAENKLLGGGGIRPRKDTHWPWFLPVSRV